MGSDHDGHEEGSFRVPTIYMNDWPDVFIHTNQDTPDNMDATKLQRVAVIGAASGYFLASAGLAEGKKHRRTCSTISNFSKKLAL
jgi:hypothetical protein